MHLSRKKTVTIWRRVSIRGKRQKAYSSHPPVQVPSPSEVTVVDYGKLSIALAWSFMAFGIVTGSVIGMYAFGGPFSVPKSQGDYANLPRRMVRLGHIASVALPMILVLYGTCIDRTPLTQQLKMIGTCCMVIGMFGVPTLLFAAAFCLPLKYLEVVPVGCVLAALLIIAYGHWLLL